MNSGFKAIARTKIFLAKIYCKMLLLWRLFLKVISKPRYIWLGVWAFKQLWWVDSRLKELALAALNNPIPERSQILNPELKREIGQRTTAIAWIAPIHPLNPLCLHRSLVLHQWLKKQGINAQLEIGWGERIGHAWVSYQGQVLNDRADIARITPRLNKA